MIVVLAAIFGLLFLSMGLMSVGKANTRSRRHSDPPGDAHR